MKAVHLALVLTGLILALPAPGRAQDAPKDKAAPGESRAIPPKEVLKSLVGSWEGTCRTWFQPDQLADESKVKGEIRLIFEGRLIRHTYEASILGKPRHGEETIVFSSMAKRFQVSWLDSFHMRDGILFSDREASPKGFTVLGKYSEPNGPPWGWKTVFELVDPDHLTITAYNIKPGGPEMKSVETRYTRVKPKAAE